MPKQLLSLFLLLMLLSGCGRSTPPREVIVPSRPVPTRAATALKPTLTASPTFTPAATLTLPQPTPTARRTRTPEAWVAQYMPALNLLPLGAKLAPEMAWQIDPGKAGWSGGAALPYWYHDSLSLALVGKRTTGGELKLLWDWQTEYIVTTGWETIYQGNAGYREGLDMFYGVDLQGKAWLVDYQLFPKSGQPAVNFAIPLGSPGHWELIRDPAGNLPPNTYLVRTGTQLSAFRLGPERIAEVFSSVNVADVPFRTFIGSILPGPDGLPAAVEVRAPKLDEAKTDIFALDASGLRLVGTVEMSMQRIDARQAELDPAGVAAYLEPDSDAAPQAWKMYRWDGDKMDWGQPIPAPTPLTPTVLKVGDAFPPLPANLYFYGERVWQKVPRAGGLPQPVKNREPIPEASESPCAPVNWIPAFRRMGVIPLALSGQWKAARIY